MAAIKKLASETMPVTVDFAEILGGGEDIVAEQATVVTGDVTVESVATKNTKVQVRLSGGTQRTESVVRVDVDTNAGNKYSVVLRVWVL